MALRDGAESPVKLDRFSLPELQALHSAVTARIAALEELDRKAEELGLSAEDARGYFARKGKRGKKPPAPVKYRLPDGTSWNGNGRPPARVREFLDSGGDLEDCRLTP